MNLLETSDKNSHSMISNLESWKYPAKKAHDESIKQILVDIKYNENDEEENAFNHSVLLELLVDRYLNL